MHPDPNHSLILCDDGTLDRVYEFHCHRCNARQIERYVMCDDEFPDADQAREDALELHAQSSPECFV